MLISFYRINCECLFYFVLVNCLFRLIINYGLYLLFNYFYLREKININYLHNPNIDSVERSQLFNATIHLI